MNLEEGYDQIPDRLKGFILAQGFRSSNLDSFGPVSVDRTSQVWECVVEKSRLHQCSPETVD